jgi:hypothetical protein
MQCDGCPSLVGCNDDLQAQLLLVCAQVLVGIALVAHWLACAESVMMMMMMMNACRYVLMVNSPAQPQANL